MNVLQNRYDLRSRLGNPNGLSLIMKKSLSWMKTWKLDVEMRLNKQTNDVEDVHHLIVGEALEDDEELSCRVVRVDLSVDVDCVSHSMERGSEIRSAEVILSNERSL